MTSPAATKITRTTVIKQVLDIAVDLGPILPASFIPKVRVTRKRDGVEMFVNQDDYGTIEVDKVTNKVTKNFLYTPTHYAVVENYDPDEGHDVVVPDKVISLYTMDDLAVMKIAELREVPEYLRISIRDRRGLRTKQDYVDAILAQRQPTGVPDGPVEDARPFREAIEG